MTWLQSYNNARRRFSADPGEIEDIECESRDLLLDLILASASAIERDWAHANDTLPYWIEAAPKQRGRQPKNEGIPWLEVAEHVPISHLTAEFGRRFGTEIIFPGLPTGGDLRFATQRALVHLDGKAAGPNDKHDEVVVPPYQLSGDGAITDSGTLKPNPSIKNGPLTFPGRNKPGIFYPSLPPIYTYDGHTKLCVTSFLKVVYDVIAPGNQPLVHMVLAIAPNGILLHDHGLSEMPLLFARGKDDRSKDPRDRRCRILFNALSEINEWRVTKIFRDSSGSWTYSNWAR